jgi:hypothetical protein
LLKSTSLEEIINGSISEAKGDLVAFIHKPILKHLKTSPNGVSVESFYAIKSEGISLGVPKLVGPAMKLSNAIVYHFPSMEYRLQSQAHKTAIKIYDVKDSLVIISCLYLLACA